MVPTPVPENRSALQPHAMGLHVDKEDVVRGGALRQIDGLGNRIVHVVLKVLCMARWARGQPDRLSGRGAAANQPALAYPSLPATAGLPLQLL